MEDLDTLSTRVDAELWSILEGRDMALYRMMTYQLGWEGEGGAPAGAPTGRRRLRGALCLMAAQACGGDLETALPAAAAVELVHNFVQVHDDLQAGSPQAGARDSVWWIWGPAQAINAGDGMHALARLALMRLGERGVESGTVFQALQVLDEAALALCEGKFMDLEAQERIDVSLAAYLKMATGKTGALFACAARLGGLTAGAAGATLESLSTFGERLGVALQMREDLRLLWPPRESQGPGPDVLNKKKLLPVVYALQRASLSEKRRLGQVYFKRVLDPSDVALLRETLEETGVREACEDMARQYLEEAVSALEGVSLADGAVEALARYARSVTSGE